MPDRPDLLVDPTGTKVDIHTYRILLVEQTYLDAHITIRNAGLDPAENTSYVIRVDEQIVYEGRVSMIPVAGWVNLNLTNISIKRPGNITITVDPEDQIQEIREDNNALTFNYQL